MKSPLWKAAEWRGKVAAVCLDPEVMSPWILLLPVSRFGMATSQVRPPVGHSVCSWSCGQRQVVGMLLLRSMAMLTAGDRGKIEDIAKRYHVGRVLLFGSGIDDKAEGRDIDLAVEGLPPSRFFSFYADLIFSLSKPVVLVDLGRKTRFTDIIRREGVPVYG